MPEERLQRARYALPIDSFLKTFLKNVRIDSVIGFVQFYRQYIPRLAEKLVPLYKLLQKDVKFQLTKVHKDAIFDINENLANAACFGGSSQANTEKLKDRVQTR